LDPFIEQDESFDLSDFYPATLETFTIEGKTWAIPYGVDSEAILSGYGVASQAESSNRGPASGHPRLSRQPVRRASRTCQIPVQEGQGKN
jgi:hypothetical protein